MKQPFFFHSEPSLGHRWAWGRPLLASRIATQRPAVSGRASRPWGASSSNPGPGPRARNRGMPSADTYTAVHTRKPYPQIFNFIKPNTGSRNPYCMANRGHGAGVHTLSSLQRPHPSVRSRQPRDVTSSRGPLAELRASTALLCPGAASALVVAQLKSSGNERGGGLGVPLAACAAP